MDTKGEKPAKDQSSQDNLKSLHGSVDTWWQSEEMRGGLMVLVSTMLHCICAKLLFFFYIATKA